MKFLASGKVKDLYDVGDSTILFKFSDRVSAYDVKFKQDIPRKGEILCKFAEFWFSKLSVPNHFLRRESDTEIVVKKMKMLPIECIVRGYFYGSLVSRWKKGTVTIPDGTDTTLAAKLPMPIFDPTTKSEHDVPINKQILGDEFSYRRTILLAGKTSLEIYQKWLGLLIMSDSFWLI